MPFAANQLWAFRAANLAEAAAQCEVLGLRRMSEMLTIFPFVDKATKRDQRILHPMQ